MEDFERFFTSEVKQNGIKSLILNSIENSLNKDISYLTFNTYDLEIDFQTRKVKILDIFEPEDKGVLVLTLEDFKSRLLEN